MQCGSSITPPINNETEKRDLSCTRIRSMNTVRSCTTRLVLILIALLSPFSFVGQTHTVRTAEYALNLPSAHWRAITVSGADYHKDFKFSEDKGIVRLRIRRDSERGHLNVRGG
jgi:hypothetical protein